MHKIYLFVLLISLVIPTKAQLKKFTVEVPQPAKFKLSDSIQSFTIMNRSMNSEFNNFDEKELQLSFYRNNFEANTVLLDSTAADTTIKALGEMLFESLRFDVVIPVERNIYRLNNFTETSQPLDWEYVQSICELYNTDALIVLENMAIRAVTNYKNGQEWDGFNQVKYHYASMDYYSRAHWRIYDPKNKNVVVDFIMNQDTIYWDNFSYDIKELFNGLPTIKGAAVSTGIRLAYNFSKIIAPTWNAASRHYFVMRNPEIDKSIELASEGNWAAALENWLQFAENGKQSEKSKVMLNVALAYEMIGDLPNAIEWAKKAQRNYYREVVNNYIKELLRREVILNN